MKQIQISKAFTQPNRKTAFNQDTTPATVNFKGESKSLGLRNIKQNPELVSKDSIYNLS